MSITHDDLGFDRSYEVEIDPDFPPSGGWEIPAFTLGHGLVIKITPRTGDRWIASFGLDPRMGLIGTYSCPERDQMLVLTGLKGYLIRTIEPGSIEQLPIVPTRATIRPDGANLVAVGSFSDVIGIDETGVSWKADAVVSDDLEFVRATAETIVIRGRVQGRDEPDLVVLETRSGKVVDPRGFEPLTS